MNKLEIEELVRRYNEGVATPSEVKHIEQLIERGDVLLTDLHDLEKFEEIVQRTDFGSPSLRLDDQFYSMLSQEKARQKHFAFQLPNWNVLLPRMAFALVFIVIGFFGTYFFISKSTGSEVKQLTQEVSDLKEMMMLSLLEKESATERLRAVSLTNEMSGVSENVTKALIKTLNNDENVNVRLAALDALKMYVQDSSVRLALVQSIAQQDSPLVQIALAELMAALQEKKSVREFEQLLKDKRTPEDVKNRIKKNLEVII